MAAANKIIERLTRTSNDVHEATRKSPYYDTLLIREAGSDAVSQAGAEKHPRPGLKAKAPYDTPRRLNSAVREWAATKREIADLAKVAKKLGARAKELETDLIPVIDAMEDQMYRVDKLIVAIQEKAGSVSYKKAYEMALDMLDGLNKDMAKQARDFVEELKKDRVKNLKIEGIGSAVGKMVTNVVRRMWGWLKKTDQKIAELEQVAVFESAVE